MITNQNCEFCTMSYYASILIETYINIIIKIGNRKDVIISSALTLAANKDRLGKAFSNRRYPRRKQPQQKILSKESKPPKLAKSTDRSRLPKR